MSAEVSGVAIVVDGVEYPPEPGHLLEHPAGHVWLPDTAWTVELTPDHVRAEGTSGQRLEWDRWQILVYRITVDNGVCRLEPLVM